MPDSSVCKVTRRENSLVEMDRCSVEGALRGGRPFYSKASSGAGLSTAAPLLQARGKPGESAARNPNYAGNAFMGPSMLLFALAGLLGAWP